MKTPAKALVIGAMLFVSGPVMAQSHDHSHDHAHDHAHDHGHDHSHDHDHAHAHVDPKIYKGYFEDAQVKDRPLADYAGDWQSVYPLLKDGTLDSVMTHKAEQGDKTADEYRSYYDVGYKTDVDRVEIDGSDVTFHKGDTASSAQYESDGYEILTYAKGNRGVRFIFRKTGGDEEAPAFIQFSDHGIAPSKASHYHLYWGNDRAALLEEVTNWPTYYPTQMTGAQIAEEMAAH